MLVLDSIQQGVASGNWPCPFSSTKHSETVSWIHESPSAPLSFGSGGLLHHRMTLCGARKAFFGPSRRPTAGFRHLRPVNRARNLSLFCNHLFARPRMASTCVSGPRPKPRRGLPFRASNALFPARETNFPRCRSARREDAALTLARPRQRGQVVGNAIGASCAGVVCLEYPRAIMKG